jgi:FAD/FMN-containing dehydrogenase
MVRVKRRALLGATGAASLAVAAPAGAKPRKIFRPGDPGYAEELRVFNLVQAPAPGLVHAAANPRDVRSAVRGAAQRCAPVAVLATGHQPTVPIGREAVVISTRAMRGVTVDAARRVARAEAGARWQDVIDKAAPAGLAPLNGSTGIVGVVGYTLGGGLSPTLGRRYGYAADHVRELDVVTADGRLRTVTPTSDPELFGGLLGGKSNFGVVTAVEFGLFPVTSYYGGSITFPGDDAGTVLHTYRNWVFDLPDTMSSSVALMHLPDADGFPPPLRGKAVVSVRIAYLGDAATGGALIRPLRASATPIMDTVAVQPYTAFGSIHADPVDPVPAYERTALLRELPAAAVDALVELAGPKAPYPITITEIRHLGGALARPPRTPNAVGHRDAEFTLFMAAIGGPSTAAAARAAEDTVIKRMRPWSTGGMYLNFMSVDDSSRDAARHAYPPEVYLRLRKLKTRVDPRNIFRLNQNIPPF